MNLVNNNAIDAVSNFIQSNTGQLNGNPMSTITKVAIGILLLGLAVVSVICYRKRKAARITPPTTPPPPPAPGALVDGVSVPESLVNGRSFLDRMIGGVYLLNCPGSVDRCARAHRELLKIGSPTYTRFNAYMGRKLVGGTTYPLELPGGRTVQCDFEYFKQKLNRGTLKFAESICSSPEGVDKWIMGTVGCYLGHLEMVKDAKRKGLKNIVIFEDDIHMRNPAELSTHLRTILGNGLPANAGICFLFWGREGIQLEDLPEGDPLRGEIARVNQYSCGQAGYIITEHAYDYLINEWTRRISPESTEWQPSDMVIKQVPQMPASSRPFEVYALTTPVRQHISVQGESEIFAPEIRRT